MIAAVTAPGLDVPVKRISLAIALGRNPAGIQQESTGVPRINTTHKVFY
jgi:hypothetical protein